MIWDHRFVDLESLIWWSRIIGFSDLDHRNLIWDPDLSDLLISDHWNQRFYWSQIIKISDFTDLRSLKSGSQHTELKIWDHWNQLTWGQQNQAISVIPDQLDHVLGDLGSPWSGITSFWSRSAKSVIRLISDQQNQIWNRKFWDPDLRSPRSLKSRDHVIKSAKSDDFSDLRSLKSSRSMILDLTRF